jgi:hypothetical protein
MGADVSEGRRRGLPGVGITPEVPLDADGEAAVLVAAALAG